jgi:hypothetical protein
MFLHLPHPPGGRGVDGGGGGKFVGVEIDLNSSVVNFVAKNKAHNMSSNKDYPLMMESDATTAPLLPKVLSDGNVPYTRIEANLASELQKSAHNKAPCQKCARKTILHIFGQKRVNLNGEVRVSCDVRVIQSTKATSPFPSALLSGSTASVRLTIILFSS